MSRKYTVKLMLAIGGRRCTHLQTMDQSHGSETSVTVTSIFISPTFPNIRIEIDIMTFQDSAEFLQTVEGEISFFRSIMRARPIGIHRHFHVLAIRNAIHRDTGHFVSADDIWNKLRTCYDLEALENIVRISQYFPDVLH